MKRDEIVYLRDVLRSIEKIERFIGSLSYEQFLDDEKTIDGVARNFEIMGEAVKSLSAELKGSAPHIEWNDIIGMRNKLIHEYWGMDLDILWKATQRDLPKLKLEVQKMLTSSKDL